MSLVFTRLNLAKRLPYLTGGNVAWSLSGYAGQSACLLFSEEHSAGGNSQHRQAGSGDKRHRAVCQTPCGSGKTLQTKRRRQVAENISGDLQRHICRKERNIKRCDRTFARKPDENVCFKRWQTGSHTLSGAETVYGSGTGAAYPGNRTNTPDSRTYGRCRASADWRSAVFCGYRSKSRFVCRELLYRHQTGSTSCIQDLFLSAI